MPKSSLPSSYRKAVKAVGDPLDRKVLSSSASGAKTRSATDRLRIEWINLEAISPDPTNPRNHSPQQIRKIAADIRKNGFTNPILVTQDNVIVAGHGRLEASKLAGLSEIR